MSAFSSQSEHNIHLLLCLCLYHCESGFLPFDFIQGTFCAIFRIHRCHHYSYIGDHYWEHIWCPLWRQLGPPRFRSKRSQNLWELKICDKYALALTTKNLTTNDLSTYIILKVDHQCAISNNENVDNDLQKKSKPPIFSLYKYMYTLYVYCLYLYSVYTLKTVCILCVYSVYKLLSSVTASG